MTKISENILIAVPVRLGKHSIAAAVLTALAQHDFIPLPCSSEEMAKYGPDGERICLGYNERTYTLIRRDWAYCPTEERYPRLHLKIRGNLNPCFLIGRDSKYYLLLNLSLHKDVKEHTSDITPAALKECEQKLIAIEQDFPIPERIKHRLG